MTDPLSFLKGVTPHECSGRCTHAAGINKEESAGRVASPVERAAPQGPPAPSLDPLCADCDEPLSAHTSPVLRDGVVVDVACPTNSCKRFVG